MQHCLSHVRPGGYAAVTMPSGAAGRRAGRRIRGNLLRAGALRAVVSLPGTGPGGAAPPDVWVLRRPAPGDPAPSHVLLIDTAGGSLADAAAAWRAFLADPEQPASATARAVRVIDLLDDEVDVSPARHLARPVAVDSRGFRTARAALRDVVERLAASLPDLDEADDAGPPAAEVTLGELVRAGAVTLHQAPLRMTVDNGETPVLTVRDVRQGRPPSGRTTVDAGTVLLQPGDVVTPVVAREPAVLVVTEPGAALGPQLHLLRPDPQRLDPHFLAGYLRVAQSLGGQRGSLASRSDVHRLTLPRLPLSRQRRYGEVFRQLAEFEETARQAGALAEALVRQGLAGLAVGALRPGQRARRRGGGAR